MISLLFLVTVLYNGALIHNLFINSKNSINRFTSYFLLGSIFSVVICFILLQLFKDMGTALIFYGVLFLIVAGTTLRKIISKIKIQKPFLLAFIFGLAFLLFEKSFSYDSSLKAFLIQSNLYQDMGAHIPFIRYFSIGQNHYPEVPFYAGSGLLYHFMFDFYTSILEFLGMRIDIAFNVLSALSLTCLFASVVSFSKLIFKKIYIGLLACLLLIFNSDLSFIRVLVDSKFSLPLIYHHNIYQQINFFGVSIYQYFLNINVFLNQRQLIFALAWFFYCMYLLMSKKNKKSEFRLVAILSLLISLFPFWNVPVLISLYIVMITSIFVFKDLRERIIKVLLISTLLVLPQLMLIKLFSNNHISFHPGFIIQSLSVKSFFLFWIFNLGLSVVFILYSIIKANNYQRKLFLVFFSLFVVANVFQFSSDPFDNHKFFNVWIVIINMFVAFGLMQLIKGKKVFKALALIPIFILGLSGFLHMLVVKNDISISIKDYKNMRFVYWINDHIPKDAIFLTNGEIYDPLTLVGKRVYLGRPRYVFLYGADPTERIKNQSRILSGTQLAKQVYSKNRVRYIVVYKNKTLPNIRQANLSSLNKKYLKIYEDDLGIIYKI